MQNDRGRCTGLCVGTCRAGRRLQTAPAWHRRPVIQRPGQNMAALGPGRPFTEPVGIHSRHCTMGPQPALARHQGPRRLVANGVKCMSNYSELSTYPKYGNIFPMSCTVFALQELEVRTLKQSLETSLRLAKSVDY